LSNAQIEQVLSTQKLTPELQYQAMLEAGLLSSKQKLTTAQIEETLQTVLGSDADVQATMSAMELKVATDAQGNSVAKLTKRNIEAAVTSGKLTQEQALQLASMLGVDIAVKKQASSTLPKWIATLKLSAKAIWENITATLTWLATTPAGWATLAVGAITVATIAVIKHTKSLKDLQETAQDSKSAYDSTISEIKSLNDELKTTKDRINELQNKDSLTFSEEDELEKLKKTNDELERELRIKEAIAQTQGQKSANDANAAITKKSEKYNLSYSDNGTSFDTGDRIDAAQWNIEQAIQNNKELEDLYSKRKEIEDKFNNDASQFKDDKEWKQNEKNIESKKAYIKTVEEQAATYIKALMNEDDALYDSNGNVIVGQEDLVNRLKALYGNYDEYNQGETYSDTFVKHLQEKGISENVANEIKSQLTDNEIEKASTLDISPYIDENATVESVREAIKKAQEEADKNPVDGTVTFTKDPTSLLTESDDKSKTANLADLKSEADTLKSLQKELEDTGAIGVDSMQKIIKQYPEAKEALYDYMTGVKNEAELFADLENIYNDDKSQYINSLVEENQANEDFFTSIKQNYPEVISVMKSLVEEVTPDLETLKNKYISDIATEEETANQFISALEQKFPELYNQLADIYDNDKENFIKHVISENETNQDFLNFLSSNYPKLFNLLGTVYGNDVDNWTSMEQAKAQITANLINQLNAMWAEYFDGISETFGAFGSIMENADGSGYTFVGGQDDSHSYDHNLSDEENKSNAPAIGAYNNVKNKIQAAIKVANQAVSDLQGAAYDKIESSVGGLDWDDLGSDSSSSSGSGSDSSSTTNPKDYDLIERKIKKLESAISNLDTAVSDTYTSWGDRNSTLADELSSVSDEIALQQQAYQKYMDLAESVGLDGYYQDLIKNGEMDVITVDDENLQDQIDKFQDFYDKAQDCNDKIRDLNQNLKELQKTKFDNVVSQFEDISSSISHAVTMLDKYIDLADKHGYYASPELYQKQLEQYNNTLNTLTSERDTLQSKLQESVQSGLIEEGSETWNDMLQQIQSVNEEIVDTVVNIQEVGNSLRDLNFTIFERGQDDIFNLVSEGQFYVDLLDKMNKDLYDDDGKITNEGLTVQGIHSENYAAYLKQADFYAKEISAIEAELANDPANTTLIDKKQEYIEAQRESILAAYDEKNAIIDLIKDGYDKASDALSKLIDKRKEALEAEKDLHDYQKSVQEKSDKVTELEKQKAAYANDASEEAKKQVQQIEVNLKDAQEDLAETEYDKYISDQEKLLDDLQTEYEDLINDRIDNIDKELGDVADAVNLNRDTIRSTLENLSQDTELPLTKAMRDVWNSATPVVDLNTTVQGIGSTVSGITLAINDIITRLNDLIAIMRGNLDSEINNYDDGSYNPNNSTPAPTPSYESDPEPSYSYDESDDSDSGDDGNYDDLFVYKYYYPQPLDTEHSVVDRLKSNNIDASWDRRADYYAGIFGDDDYTGSDYQNIRMLDWLKEHGYAKGKRRGEYSTGYHLVGEEGNEFMITNGALREVGTEDTIFTADMAKNIADFSIDPTQYLSSHMPLPNVKPASIPNNVTSNVDTIEISLPNVTNYTEFKTQLMNDRGFKNYMSEATLGVALGHNELAVNKYK
jgi:chromosome segregation ATPase